MTGDMPEVGPIPPIRKAHRRQYPEEVLCRVLGVAPSGDYDWLKEPLPVCAQEDARLLRVIRVSSLGTRGGTARR